MTTRSRRITPIAVPPPQSLRSRPPSLVSRPLVGPILVLCGVTQHELRSGSLLIGRSQEADLVVEDPLVSRLHARIWLDDDGVRIEDLHSTNGVYLNGERLVRATALKVGDHALVGTNELLFSELKDSPTPRAAPSVPPGLQVFDPPTKPHASLPQEPASIPITARADALEMIGTLARRLANEHKAEQAPRLLGPHLQGILRGASSGLVVPDALLELAAEYAIDLAHWTDDKRWLDYVVELHLVTKRLMSAAGIAGLQRSERWIGAADRALLEYYVASFAVGSKAFSQEEKSRYAALQRLLKKR
jgi:hypothetical protein